MAKWDQFKLTQSTFTCILQATLRYLLGTVHSFTHVKRLS